MPNVLLITDTARVQKVFQSIEATGVLQLTTAATLAQGDREIAASPPAITFVQSRISGLSGDIVLQHLKKTLPPGAKLVLLASDADELEQARRQGERYLDFSLSDQELTKAIHDALSGVFAPVTASVPAASEPSPEKSPAATAPPNPAAAAAAAVAPPDAEPHPLDKVSFGPQPALPLPNREVPEPPARPFADHLKGGGELGADPALRPISAGAAAPNLQYGRPLAEALRSAEQKERPSWVVPLTVASLVASLFCFQAGKKAGLRHELALRGGEPVAVPPTPAATPAAKVASGTKPAAPAPAPLPPPATPVPQLSPSPAPVAAAKPTPAATPATAAKVAELPRPAAKPIAPAAAPALKPVPKPPAAPAKPAAPPAPVPVAKAPKPLPPAKKEHAPLPSVVASAKLDANYGKTHPGWLRYVGTDADYKVYREAGGIKAIQVFAKSGKTIPQTLSHRVMREFAGIERYQVQSKGVKENYLVERGVAEGGVAVTVYRKKSDAQVKALVLYFK